MSNIPLLLSSLDLSIPLLSLFLSLLFTQECFNSPYGVKHFPKYAEPIPGETTEALAKLAKECKVYLIGGNEMFIRYMYMYKKDDIMCK